MVHPMSDIFLLSGKEVINNSYFMTLHHQLIDQVGTDKSGSASHQDFLSSLITEDRCRHGVRGSIRRQRLCRQKFLILDQSRHDVVFGELAIVGNRLFYLDRPVQWAELKHENRHDRVSDQHSKHES